MRQLLLMPPRLFALVRALSFAAKVVGVYDYADETWRNATCESLNLISTSSRERAAASSPKLALGQLQQIGLK